MTVRRNMNLLSSLFEKAVELKPDGLKCQPYIGDRHFCYWEKAIRGFGVFWEDTTGLKRRCDEVGGKNHMRFGKEKKKEQVENGIVKLEAALKPHLKWVGGNWTYWFLCKMPFWGRPKKPLINRTRGEFCFHRLPWWLYLLWSQYSSDVTAMRSFRNSGGRFGRG